MSVGFVIGKFMPPHRGHIQLVEFAKTWVDTLYVVVEAIEGEPIPSSLRYSWMKELFPDCCVIHLETFQPQNPDDTPDFWSIWKQTLQRVLPQPIDIVFASEPYGKPLAEVLDASFVPVDIARQSIPVSATMIRENPVACWRFLPESVQDYYRKKVCIFGPESTGKSTLAKRIAEMYQGRLVPEFARGYLEVREGNVSVEDMLNIAKGQSILEQVSSKGAGPLLVCDTDPLTTSIWSTHLFGACEAEIIDIAQKHHYDLTFLLNVDVPFVPDMIRYLPEERVEFFETCKRTLQAHHRTFVVVEGSWEERWEIVQRSMTQMLASKR